MVSRDTVSPPVLHDFMGRYGTGSSAARMNSLACRKGTATSSPDTLLFDRHTASTWSAALQAATRYTQLNQTRTSVGAVKIMLVTWCLAMRLAT